MTVRVDDKNRIRLPDLLQPGQEYQPESPAPGIIVLRLSLPTEGNVIEDVVKTAWEQLGPAPEVDYDQLPKG